MRRYAILFFLGFALGGPAPGLAQGSTDVSQEDVDKAARSIARYCKTLVQRMDGLINEEWATQDLSALASVWESLNCYQLFGFDPAPAAAGEGGERKLRWIVR